MTKHRKYITYVYDDKQLHCSYSSDYRIGSTENFNALKLELNRLYGKFNYIRTFEDYKEHKGSIYRY